MAISGLLPGRVSRLPRTRALLAARAAISAVTLLQHHDGGRGHAVRLRRATFRSIWSAASSCISFFWRHPAMLLSGLPFSLTLLAILLAHEFGHYLAALYHGVDASLPYFLPSPVLGTFGAFIRVRSPIYSKRSAVRHRRGGSAGGFCFSAAGAGDRPRVFQSDSGHRPSGRAAVRNAAALQWILQHAIFPGRQSRAMFTCTR